MPKPPGKLSRQRTSVRPRMKRNPRRRKRQAYAPWRKRRNVRRANPVRETKTRSGEEVFDTFTGAVSDVEGIDHPNRTTGPHQGKLTFWPTANTAGIGGIVRVIPPILPYSYATRSHRRAYDRILRIRKIYET